MAKTMVQECFSQIGNRFDMITRSLKRNYLPYDAEVEYVKTDGTNYVDTGILSAAGIASYSLNFTALPGNENKSYALFGVYDDAQSNPWSGSFGRIYYSNSIVEKIQQYAASGVSGSVNINKAPPCSINITMFNEAYINGEFCNNGASKNSISHYSFLLGALHSNNNVEHHGLKVGIGKSFFIDNIFGNCIKAFIPVRVNQIGYLYDLVSEQFFGSATDTPLVPGPDKS